MNNIPTSVEIVCQTEYQDIYRIKPYVLLVVDKFTLGKITTPNNYRFKLKTSGEEFSGNSDEFCGLLRNVARVIGCYKNVE